MYGTKLKAHMDMHGMDAHARHHVHTTLCACAGRYMHSRARKIIIIGQIKQQDWEDMNGAEMCAKKQSAKL